jgi:predicted nucleic acid-binding protein
VRLLTIDSSVFVSAARQGETGNAESTIFLRWVRESGARLFLPTLLIAEVAAALSRTGSAPVLAQQYALAIGHLPNTVLVALDEALAHQAAALGARHKLRGADCIFLASAALFAAQLVTLDREQLQRGSSIVQTLSPGEFLKTANS